MVADMIARQVGFTPTQVATLGDRAITPEAAASVGLVSVQTPDDLQMGMSPTWISHLPGIAFPFTGADGHVEWQFRPDMPPVDASGKSLKYLMRSTAEGYRPTLWIARRGAENGVRLLVEGSCQTVAAATYAPEGTWVIGMFGCYGWSADGAPLPELWDFAGQHAVVAMDGDMWTNPNVWEAGERLQTNLGSMGVAGVRWLKLGNGTKASGLDDMLARQPPERRATFLANLIDNAIGEKFPKSRVPKPVADPVEFPETRFFGSDGLLVETLAGAVREAQPVALSEANTVACYADGVYRVDQLALSAVVGDLLGQRFRKEHLNNTEEFLLGRLHRDDHRLPIGQPMLTYVPATVVANGVLDLTSGQLHPWSPGHMATYKCPIVWDPTATCPRYDAWIREVLPEQEQQFDEFMWRVLDCSTVSQKAGFLIGKSRSGKGTALRIAEKIVGSTYTSSVSLHQLSDDHFAAANLYGKRLNTAGDLSAAHVRDVSAFKQLTGEDPVNANPKYGRQFRFRNQALFLFAANEIPTVSETSDAYLNRMVPFVFDNTFAGREDPTIEQAIYRELPGILGRWVRAGLARMARGGDWIPTPEHVAARFAEGSDRVRLFITEACDIVPLPSQAAEPLVDRGTSGAMLYQAFQRWVSDSGGAAAMGRNKFLQRLGDDPRVSKVRIQVATSHGYNLVIKGH